MKEKLRPLSQKIRGVGGFLRVKKLESERTGDFKEYEYWRDLWPEPEFPVVRTHPDTGKKAIFVTRGYSKSVHGPGAEEVIKANGGSQRALINKLADLVKVPEYQARFRWRKTGDLLMWDNRSVQHCAVADYWDEERGGGPRWMDHVTTMGSTPKVDAPG